MGEEGGKRGERGRVETKGHGEDSIKTRMMKAKTKKEEGGGGGKDERMPLPAQKKWQII